RAQSGAYTSQMEADNAAGQAGALGKVASRRATQGARQIADALGRLREIVGETGDAAEGAQDDASAAAERFGETLRRTGDAAGAAGRAAKKAGDDAAEGAERAKSGWARAAETVAEYASKAKDWGSQIGSAITGAFQGAENAVGEFVRTGKLSIKDLVSSTLAEFAKIAARRWIFGPLAEFAADVMHTGGVVGVAGSRRSVPALAFAGAPRFHQGVDLGLRADEVPAILQRGERVLSRREAREYRAEQPVVVNISTPDIESFRRSRAQVAADIGRAVAVGRRSM
uniref:phage tail tape measure C-terminal domain-containing protein n=1 Tax=Rhodosalinus sp. K401 TaxID=3239195 RepID=UPI003523A84C